VKTPSQRIWEDLGRAERRAEASAHPVRRERAPETLAHAAERVAAGEDLRAATAEFLDDLKFARDADEVRCRLTEEPQAVNAHVDAYLAALAEHVAMRWEIRTPAWALASDRFLDHFWWPSRTIGLRAIALVQSPPAFRRRGIFIGATTLHRV
jgi:hypothetical protein